MSNHESNSACTKDGMAGIYAAPISRAAWPYGNLVGVVAAMLVVAPVMPPTCARRMLVLTVTRFESSAPTSRTVSPGRRW